MFQSLKGILSDLDLTTSLYRSILDTKFQSLKGILSDLDSSPHQGVNPTLHVSIPKRDFIGFRPTLSGRTSKKYRFQSLKGILSDLDGVCWEGSSSIEGFQSLKGILSDLDLRNDVSVPKCGGERGFNP